MNAYKFSIANTSKDSLDKPETFKTLEGRLTDLFFIIIINQTFISTTMLTTIHIWICLVFKKAKAQWWKSWRSHLQNMIHKQSRYQN